MAYEDDIWQVLPWITNYTSSYYPGNPDGGVLAVVGDPNDFGWYGAIVQWLDTIGSDKEYHAIIAKVYPEAGDDLEDLFLEITDPDVVIDLGEYETPEECETALRKAINV